LDDRHRCSSFDPLKKTNQDPGSKKSKKLCLDLASCILDHTQMSKVKLALIQMSDTGTPEGNLKKAVERTKQAASNGAKIVCLQELFKTRYFCQEYDAANFKLAESIPGPTTQVFSKIAKEKKIVIIVSLFEKRAQGLYHNTAVVIDADGSLVGKYRKMHIPDDPHFYEKYYFTVGDLGFKTFETRYAKVGVLVCWDQWFPEAARLTALQGAQILFYPTAIGWHENDRAVSKNQITGWQTVQRGHAVANEVFVAAPNRVGKEGPVTFWGHSFVSDPFGTVIAQASDQKEEILYADCDLSQIEEIREGWPFLRDRRIDAYGPITERFIDAALPAKQKKAKSKKKK
jgi:N-carbamoylputrescine amidase